MLPTNYSIPNYIYVCVNGCKQLLAGLIWHQIQSTAVSLNHLDYNETLGEKVRYQLLNYAAYYFEQLLEAVPTKQSLHGHLLPSHKPSKMSKTSWALLKRQRRTHKRCSMNSCR